MVQKLDSFEQLLFDLSSTSDSKREKGTKFERLIKKYLSISPLYSEIYDEIWFGVSFHIEIQMI